MMGCFAKHLKEFMTSESEVMKRVCLGPFYLHQTWLHPHKVLAAANRKKMLRPVLKAVNKD
jgi:hypothetical protein